MIIAFYWPTMDIIKHVIVEFLRIDDRKSTRIPLLGEDFKMCTNTDVISVAAYTMADLTLTLLLIAVGLDRDFLSDLMVR